MFYIITLENIFDARLTVMHVKTDDIDSYLYCNSDIQFQEVLDIEEITEKEYNKEVS